MEDPYVYRNWEDYLRDQNPPPQFSSGESPCHSPPAQGDFMPDGLYLANLHSSPEPRSNNNNYDGERPWPLGSEETYQPHRAAEELQAPPDHIQPPVSVFVDAGGYVSQSTSHPVGVDEKQVAAQEFAESPSVETNSIGTQNPKKRKKEMIPGQPGEGSEEKPTRRKKPRILKPRNEYIPVGTSEVGMLRTQR